MLRKKQLLYYLIPIVAIAIALSVMVGWIFNYTVLLSAFPAGPTMKFNTALLFIFISVAILFSGNSHTLFNKLAIVFALATFIISSLTLSQYIFEINLGIDNFFLKDSLPEKFPGRMSRASALCFILLSLSKIFRYSRIKILATYVDYFVTLVAIISLLAIATYVMQLLAINQVFIFGTLALHTALLFFFLSLAISLKHPDHSYVGFLTGEYVGSRQARNLLPFVVGLPVILSTVLLYALNTGYFETDYGVALYTICYAVISIIYFSAIFTKLNKADQERSSLEEALQESNRTLKQYKQALDQSSVVTITDKKGTITYVNKKFTEISGYTQEEVIGENLRIIKSGHHPESFFKELWNTVLKGKVWIGGIKNKSKFDRYYWLHTVIVPLTNTDGNIEQFLTISQDITHHTNLADQYKQLKLRNKEMEQFTYLASHDLQEPLRTLKSMAKLLQMEYASKLEEGGLKAVDYIESAAIRMSNLIKALLDYSLIGKQKKLESVDTHIIVESVLEDLSIIIKEVNATVTFTDLPKLKAYKTELRLLFQNLIQNAIKFRSKERKPKIDISATADGENVTYCISDNGIGIPKDQLNNIFSLFKKLHNKKLYKGTGIGLAHCEKIVHLHGGSIWATSDLGKGTSFYFTIPL